METRITDTETAAYERTMRSTASLLDLLIRHHGGADDAINSERNAVLIATLPVAIDTDDDEEAEPIEVCILPIVAPTITVDLIKRAVCRHYGVSHAEIISPRRDMKIRQPRMVAVYLARELTTLGLPAIGRHFGGRDHTTILHSARKIAAQVAADHPVTSIVKSLREQLAA